MKSLSVILSHLGFHVILDIYADFPVIWLHSIILVCELIL